MSLHAINFAPVNLGSGWTATQAWVTGGPIVLIQAQSQTEEVFTRLDMDKSMFIDPLPIKATKNEIQNLVVAVNAVSEKPSW